MELPGELFLYNFSILAITFSAVSALVALLRQMTGGKLTGFDVFLIGNYVGHGFVLAICAVLPPLVAQIEFPAATTWMIASAIASVALGSKTGIAMHKRYSAAHAAFPLAIAIFYATQWLAVLLLLANTFIQGFQGLALYSLALTVSLSGQMWSFVRRIASLTSQESGDGFDPKRG